MTSSDDAVDTGATVIYASTDEDHGGNVVATESDEESVELEDGELEDVDIDAAAPQEITEVDGSEAAEESAGADSGEAPQPKRRGLFRRRR